MRNILILSTVFLATCSSAVEKHSVPNLSYTLTPHFADTENRLDVKLNFRGDQDGETTIRVGARWKRDDKAGKRFRNLAVIGEGARLPANLNQPLLSIKHAAGADLTVSYTLSSSDMDDAANNIEYFYVPVLLPEVIHLIGSTSLIVPQWDDTEANFNVKINWENLPNGWNNVDTLPERTLSSRELGSQILAAAPSEHIAIKGDAYKLTILKVGEHDFARNAFSESIVNIYEGLNALWADKEPQFLVTLLGAPVNSSHASFTGTGRFNSFASASSRGISLDFLEQFLAHEVAHHWIPAKLGRWPSCQDGEKCAPRISWFSEGFTDFVMTRALLSEGIWAQNDLIDFTNQYLRNYYHSPAQTAKAHKIDDLFWEDFEHEKQPYWRGFLLAMNWDTEIREYSMGNMTAMDILKDMNANMDKAAEGNIPILTPEYITENFNEKSGRNLLSDIERFYHNGEVLKPHPDMFQGCATLKFLPVYSYDVGFDAKKTLSSGIVTGVLSDHNSAKAGLRNGQEFIAKNSGGGGDTTLPIVLQVKDKQALLQISYLPVSGDPISMPQFEKTGDCGKD